MGTACSPAPKVAKREIGKVMRAANGADKACTFGPAVGSEQFADIDLGAPVKPLNRRADGRAGGWYRAVGDGAPRIHHGVDNLGIAGAATQNSAKGILDSLPVRCRVLPQQRGGRHHHTRGADAALCRAMTQKCRL